MNSNPDNPRNSREQLEAELTALVLGELPADKAFDLGRTLEKDAELARLYERLKQTVGLVRETAASAAEEKRETPSKLSEERRQKLLGHFKTVTPKQFTAQAPRRRFTWLEVAAVLAVLALLAALMLPALSRSKSKSMSLAARFRDRESLDGVSEESVTRHAGKPWGTELVQRTRQLSDDSKAFSKGARGDKAPEPGAKFEEEGKVASVSTLARNARTEIALPPSTQPDPQLHFNQWSLNAPEQPDSLRNKDLAEGLVQQTEGRLGIEDAPAADSDMFRRRYGLAVGGEGGGGGAGGGMAPKSRGFPTLGPIGEISAHNQGIPSEGGKSDFYFETPRAGFAGPSAPGVSQEVDPATGLPATASGLWGVDPAQVTFPAPAGPADRVTSLIRSLGRQKLAEAEVLGKKAELANEGDSATLPMLSSAGRTLVPGLAEKPSLGTVDSLSDAVTLPAAGVAAGRDEPKLKLAYGDANGLTQQLNTYSFGGTAATNSIVLPPTPEAADIEYAKRTAPSSVALPKQVLEAPARPPQTPAVDSATREAAQPAKPVDELQVARAYGRRSQIEASKEVPDVALKSRVAPPTPQPEIQARENAFSTFSLNVSDVSFKLASASLENGQMPEPASIRSEEFINAFNYRDPEPQAGMPLAFASDRAAYPFAHNRDLLRFSIKTAAQGRETDRPLNLVLVLDNSGSMERADRVQIIREALNVLASQLHAQDKLSVVTFARTARLWVDGASGDQAGAVARAVGNLTPQGGTDLEGALDLGYQTALRHYVTNGQNRVVLLTDGAANLGNVEPPQLKQKVEAHRKQGVALDCFGIGWEGYNDDLLEVLSRNGDGRYGFINTPEEATTDFAGQLAGALHVAASDVKVQVEFNPNRVTAYRQIGYAKHQLTKEQFRDNTVDAAEIAAAESGNALYVIESNPAGSGPVATVRVRYKVPGTSDYHEHAWDVPYSGKAMPLEQASLALRLAATASAFSEWLAGSPYAAEVTPDRLLNYLDGVPDVWGADARPKKLAWMLRQAKSISGK